MELIIGATYYDKDMGPLVYIGRYGYEFKPKDIKTRIGRNYFVMLVVPGLIGLTKSEIKELKIYRNGKFAKP